jgi:hypothetical protein
MSNKEKPLPKAPNRAFGRKKQFGQEEEQGALLADRMAAAMAEGKLDEFLKQEMPDNEYARNLATMMMGMTGMLPAGVGQPSSLQQEKTEERSSAKSGTREQMSPADEIPEDVKKAIQGGDVQGLMDMLRREHQKRMPGAETGPEEEAAAPHSPDQPAIDKAIIDALIRIAADNSVTLDWIILRAIKVYVEEYRKTGKL